MIDSSRMLVKNFFPAPMAKVILGYERLTGRTFRSSSRTTASERRRRSTSRTTRRCSPTARTWWPSHTKYLDFELELACVLAKPLVDATPEEAIDAVGGWFIMND